MIIDVLFHYMFVEIIIVEIIIYWNYYYRSFIMYFSIIVEIIIY